MSPSFPYATEKPSSATTKEASPDKDDRGDGGMTNEDEDASSPDEGDLVRVDDSDHDYHDEGRSHKRARTQRISFQDDMEISKA